MRGRKRPADERANAAGIAVIHGGAEAARRTGIPERTIQQWMESDEFAELRVRTKDQVAEEWWAGVQHGFRVVIREFDQRAPLQAKATAAAILFDKLAMVRGEATSRTESRTLLDGYDDEEKQALGRAIDAELERVRAEAAGQPQAAAVGSAGQNGSGPLPTPSAD